MSVYEHRGRHMAQFRMSTLAIIKNLDVLDDFVRCRLTCREVLVMHELGFEGRPKTFRRRVVVTIPGATHRALHFKLPQHALIVVCAILASAVTVEKQPRWRSMTRYRAEQCTCHQVMRHALTERIPDNLTGKEIFNPREVQPTFLGRDVSDVADPLIKSKYRNLLPYGRWRTDSSRISAHGRRTVLPWEYTA